MKITLLMLVVAACACAAYARPEGETTDPLVVTLDLDEFLTQLRAKFADGQFLQQQLGPFNLVPKPPGSAPAGDAVVQQGWTKLIPWKDIFDVVVDVVKKVAKA